MVKSMFLLPFYVYTHPVNLYTYYQNQDSGDEKDMKKFQIKLGVLSLAIFLSLGLSGCGGSSGNSSETLALASLLSSSNSTEALTGNQDTLTVSTSLSDQELAETFRPYWYFHPNEEYFPVSYEFLIQNAALIDSNGNTVKAEGSMSSAADLANYSFNEDGDWLDINDTGKNGDLASAKTYVRILEDDTYKYITYSLVYGFNGCYTFRMRYEYYTTWPVTNKKKRNFPWCNFGRHYYDAEKITVKIRKSDGYFMSLTTASHGNEDEHTYNDITWTNTYRPRIYVAVNTHGTYVEEATFIQETILDLDANFYSWGGWSWLGTMGLFVEIMDTSTGKILWLKGVDTTTNDDFIGGLGSHTIWDVTTGDIEILTEASTLTAYSGTFGQESIDNSNVQSPTGNITNFTDSKLKSLGQEAVDNNMVPDAFMDGSNGPGIWSKGWFDYTENKTTLYNRTHGECMSINAGADAVYNDGDDVIRENCDGTSNVQNWYIDSSTNLIHNVDDTTLCLEMSGSNVIVSTCNSSDTYQQWTLNDQYIRNVADSDKAIFAWYSSTSVTVSSYSNNYQQYNDRKMRWSFSSYVFRNIEHGQCLSVDVGADGVLNDGDNVIREACTGASKQRWYRNTSTNEVVNQFDTTLCLTMTDLDVFVNTCAATTSQQWSFNNRYLAGMADTDRVLVSWSSSTNVTTASYAITYQNSSNANKIRWTAKAK